MNTEDKIKFWQERSKECFLMAENQFKNTNYLWTLFFCHLSLEKLLKSRVIEQTKNEPPHTHDLVLLAQIANIKLKDLDIKQLETFTGFNIETRYEDYKEALKKKVDKKFTKEYLIITKRYLKWF